MLEKKKQPQHATSFYCTKSQFSLHLQEGGSLDQLFFDSLVTEPFL